MPASTPLATGSSAMPSARGEPKATSSKATIATVPAMASRSTSLWMRAREATPNTPGPLISSVRPGAVAASAAKRVRTSACACACPSRSPPSARTVASSSARGCSRDTQTPPSLRGAFAGSIASAMRTVSPVGSRQSSGLSGTPAGVPSSETVSAMPSRRPSTVNRSALTAGLSR